MRNNDTFYLSWRFLFSLLASFLVSLPFCRGALAFSTDTAAARLQIQGLPPLCAWLPAGRAKAAVLCIHGLGLHMGSYRELGETLCQKGIAVYAIDVRGFGEWHQHGQDKLDFEGSFADIGKTLDYIHSRNPDTPVLMLGESMGGAIALQAAAKFQDKVQALICSVPSGDRKSGLGADMHIGLRVLAGGFKQRFDVGSLIIDYATANETHRQLWANDPRSRKMFSPAELLTFQHFMDKNEAAAGTIKTMPVLFIQGTKDRLVLGSGTWDVYDHVVSANKKLALSMAAEHLIYENGQTSDEDLSYTLNWIDQVKNLAHAGEDRIPAEPLEGLAGLPKRPVEDSTPPAMLASVPAQTPRLIRRGDDLSYWIELKRGGQVYRCNNKIQFQSGDEIRFHLCSAADGFAYIFMQQGSTGGRAVLFPENATGTNNNMLASVDCAIPTRTYLKFDNNPGTEQLSLVFAKHQIDIDKAMNDPSTVMAYVSPDRSGAKDLVPTRMQIEWSDPKPVLMLGATGGVTGDAGIVKVSCHNSQDVLSLQIALEHK